MIPAEALDAAHRAWREQAATEGSVFEYFMSVYATMRLVYAKSNFDSRAEAEIGPRFLIPPSMEVVLSATTDRETHRHS